MDIINDNEAKLYKHFLTSSLGSAMVMSIYTMADAVMRTHKLRSAFRHRRCIADEHTIRTGTNRKR